MPSHFIDSHELKYALAEPAARKKLGWPRIIEEERG
jgi:hypothetical protein